MSTLSPIPISYHFTLAANTASYTSFRLSTVRLGEAIRHDDHCYYYYYYYYYYTTISSTKEVEIDKINGIRTNIYFFKYIGGLLILVMK